jgi:hypothetical protein
MDPYQPPNDWDSDNPYAPPHTSPAAAVASGMPFTVNDVFNWSRAIFTERMRFCLAIFWGVVGMSLAVGLGLNFVQEGMAAAVRDANTYKIIYIILMFTNYVIQAWLGIGMTLAMLKIARGEPVMFEDAFRGGPFLLTAILAWVVHKVMIAVPILVATGVIIAGIVMMENQSGVAAFLLFLVVSSLAGLVFIYLAARVSMYYYLVIDRNAGVFDSLLQSWRLCRNQVGTITLVYFVQFAVLLAGLLACAVGLIFAFPLMSLIETVTYLALVTGATSGDTKPRFSWDDDV